MIKFREWLLEKQIKKDIEKSNELFCFFESFDKHYDITKIYENKSVNINFYEFRINKNTYRIFIENIDKFISL